MKIKKSSEQLLLESFLNQPDGLSEVITGQIHQDLNYNDQTSIIELLSYIPFKVLIQYLPEDTWKHWENEYKNFKKHHRFINKNLTK